MQRTGTTIAIVALAACLAGPGHLRADRKPVELPPDLARLLTDAQADLRSDRLAQAVERLTAFKGKDDHALRHLVLGHAYLRQDRLPDAARAYAKALDMDKTLTEAALALAQVRGRQEKWPRAAELLGRYAATDSCPADVLLLYAQVARRIDDTRLCTLLVRKGIVRFPGDQRFRRLDLAAQADAGDYAAVRQSVLLLLGKTPAEAALWQHLAFAHGKAGNDADALAAVEAAVLCDPSDMDARRRFLGGHLAAGDWLTACKHGQALLAGPHAKAAGAKGGVMDMLIRAADMGRKDDLLARWLARVPGDARPRAMQLAAANLAQRRSRPAEAAAVLARLIRSGETDASVFIWAGHLAETAKDWPRAEALYDQARKCKGPAARLAVLYLARLHFTLERFDRAAGLLNAYLDAYPADTPARALLAVVKARLPAQ